MPQDSDSRICDPWQTIEFGKFMESDDASNCFDKCLPDCDSTDYSVSSSSAPFR